MQHARLPVRWQQRHSPSSPQHSESSGFLGHWRTANSVKRLKASARLFSQLRLVRYMSCGIPEIDEAAASAQQHRRNDETTRFHTIAAPHRRHLPQARLGYGCPPRAYRTDPSRTSCMKPSRMNPSRMDPSRTDPSRKDPSRIYPSPKVSAHRLKTERRSPPLADFSRFFTASR